MSRHCSRQQFLALTLGSIATAAFGCSEDAGDSHVRNAAGGTGGSGTGGGSGGNPPKGSGGSTSSSGGSSNASGGSKSGAGGSNNSSAGSTSNGGKSSGSGGGTPSGGSPGGGGDGCSGDRITALCSKTSGATGHYHILYIPVADILAAKGPKTYKTETEGDLPADAGGGHCHQIELTAADLATLKSGGVVKKVTCSGGDHQFIISCAPTDEKPATPPADQCAGPNANLGACSG